MNDKYETGKTFVDGIAFAASLGVVAGVVSTAVGLATLAWTLLRIYEMKTVQDWLARRKK